MVDQLDLTAFRDETTKNAPSSASLSAIASPIPAVDAVTTATLPVNLLAIDQLGGWASICSSKF